MKFTLRRLVSCVWLAGLILASSAGTAATLTLTNGTFLDIEKDQGLPRQTVVMVFPGGPALIPETLQGTTEVVTDILDEGPSSMSPDEYRRALFLANAEIKVGASMRAMIVTVRAPAAKLRQALDLAEKVLREPRLDAKTFGESHAKVTTRTKVAFDEMQSVVFYYGVRRATLGDPGIYDGSGSPATVKNITLNVVKDVYGKLFDRAPLYFVSAGPAEPAAVGKAVSEAFLNRKDTPKFVRSPGRDIDVAGIIKKSTPGLSVTVINKPNAVDNQVLFVFPEEIRRATKEDVIASVTHNLLGGGSVGRLGKSLRKERGLTYHASSFVGQPGWMVYTFGGDEQVEPLLKGVLDVVGAFKAEALSPTEIAEAKVALDNTHRQRFELPSDVLMEKIRLRLFGRDEDYITKYQDYLKAVTDKDVQSFARGKINTAQGTLIVMGDRGKLLPVLAKAGYAKDKIRVIEVADVM